MKFLTEEIPGIDGRYKQTPDDFQVEEIPLYPCSGKGEHLYLWIEKTGITTRDLIRQLARQLKLKEREIGYAGLKDARALTRQTVSIPFSALERLGTLNLSAAKILKIDRHTNKLRLGHLAGNRFTITLRETIKNPTPRVQAIVSQLQKRGVPNLFGEQRYGALNNSDRLGTLLLRRNFVEFCREFLGNPELIRDPDWREAARLYRADKIDAALTVLPNKMWDEKNLLQALASGKPHRTAVFSLPHSLLRLFLSATQSHLFDQLLLQRLPHIDQLQDGDIAVKHVNGACFLVEQAGTEQPRVESFEISPSAPLLGHKVLLAEGEQGKREQTILRQSHLQLTDWKLGQGLTMSGERRALRVPLAEMVITERSLTSLTLSFTLPKGSYATSLLREIIKHP